MELREDIDGYLTDMDSDIRNYGLSSKIRESAILLFIEIAKSHLPELAKAAGYVKLAIDQELPEIPENFKPVKYYKSIYDMGWRAGYNWLKRNIKDWRKVEELK